MADRRVRPDRGLKAGYLFVAAAFLSAAGYGRADDDIYQYGYAARRINPTRPTVTVGFDAKVVLKNVLTDIFVKCSVIRDEAGNRLAIVSADVMEFPEEYADGILSDIQGRFGLPPARVMLNASHSHSSPPIEESALEFPERDFQPDWAAFFRRQLVGVVGDALANLRPARIRLISDYCGIGINRRRFTPGRGVANTLSDLGVLFAPNPGGSTDPEVQVFVFENATDRKIMSVLVKFACHPTTANQQGIGGDYIGWFQELFEAGHPGLAAQFLQGCAADVKTWSFDGDATRFPAGTPEMARDFARQLAASVDRAISKGAPYLSGPIRVRLETVPLPIRPLARADFQAKLKAPEWWDRRWAERGLKELKTGRPFPREIPLRVRTVRLGQSEGQSALLIALGAEVFSEYSRRIQQLTAPLPTVVIGYADGMAGYLPTAAEIPKGGYEIEIFRWWNYPGPFAPQVEEVVLDEARRIARWARD